MNFDAITLTGLALAAALVNGVAVAGIVRIAPRIGLVDRPNARSLHIRITPRGGGIGLVLVVALGSFVASGRLRSPAMEIYWAGSLFVAGVSLRDDFRSLTAGLRFFCQLAAAGLATWGIAQFETVSLPGGRSLAVGGMGGALTMLWIVGLTNVYNFMDGIDGIAAVQGVGAGAAWLAAGLWLSSPTVALLGALLAGGCLGFLFHNWSPARIFMGDVGSAFLGFSFAVLPLLALSSAVGVTHSVWPGTLPYFALLTVWPFVADGFYTFIRRAWRGESVWRPHRSHLYQRLVQAGWSHARVSLLYGAWGAVSAIMALLWLIRARGWMATGVALGSLAAVFVLVKRAERAPGVQHAYL
jgi:UDP-N-acetylmuramyl pentapeptide phosphotransferase/UDP-N-acetylglucosamine-1-phosphate transferase